MGFVYSFSIRLLGLFSVRSEHRCGEIALARLERVFIRYTSWFNLLSNAVSFGLPQYAIRHISILHAEKETKADQRIHYLFAQVFLILWPDIDYCILYIRQ